MQFVGGLVLSCAIAIPIATARGTLLGTNLFPANNPWNQNIAQAPVATSSAAIMSSIIATYGNGRFHPDFGQDYQAANTDVYGIPYNVVHPGYGAWAQKPPVYQFRGNGPQSRDYQREPDPGGRGNFRDDYRPQLLRGGRPVERVVRYQPGAGNAH
jgi:hypothetical protein